MTAVRATSTKLGQKARPNKKLFYVLGVVIVLAVLFKLAPGLLGGGGGASVAPLQPRSAFHIVKPQPVGSGPGLVVPDSGRDPFGAPSGYGNAHP